MRLVLLPASAQDPTVFRAVRRSMLLLDAPGALRRNDAVIARARAIAAADGSSRALRRAARPVAGPLGLGAAARPAAEVAAGAGRCTDHPRDLDLGRVAACSVLLHRQPRQGAAKGHTRADDPSLTDPQALEQSAGSRSR
jgi:hypothetical protein